MKRTMIAGLVLALGMAAAMPANADEQALTGPGGILEYIGAQTGLSGFADAGNPGIWSLIGSSATFTPVAAWAGNHNHFGFALSGNPLAAEPANTVYGSHVYNPATDNGFLTGSKGLPSFPDNNQVTNMVTPDDWSHGIATLNLADATGTFRFVLDSMSNEVEQNLWSSLASENSDGIGHLKAYSTNVFGTYILAWEDLPNNISDHDYNDFVLVATGIRPVPEPGTLALLGTGVLGLVGWARRRKA